MLIILLILLQLILHMIEYAGATVRSSDVFGQSKNAIAMTKRFIKGLKVRIFVIFIVPSHNSI